MSRHSIVRFALAPCALALALHAAAAEPAADAAPGSVAQVATEPAPGALPPAQPPPQTTDLALLSRQLAGERRTLQADAVEFPVFVRPMTAGPARGALLLIPGDGAYPTASSALEQLRQLMPAQGWSTWLISLESPPRTHSGQLTPAPDPQAGAAPSPAGADEELRATALREWSVRCQARIAGMVSAASADGPVVLVAEHNAAALLSGFLAAQPGAAKAAVMIEPLDLPGLASEWPGDLATPVLEMLDPATRREQGARRREQANALGLHHYRQIMITVTPWQPGSGETLLAKRLRGWLSTLDLDQSPSAGAH